MYIDFTRGYKIKHLNYAVKKCIDMVYFWVKLDEKPILYPMYDSYNVTTCSVKIVTTYPMVVFVEIMYASKTLAHS